MAAEVEVEVEATGPRAVAAIVLVTELVVSSDGTDGCENGGADEGDRAWVCAIGWLRKRIARSRQAVRDAECSYRYVLTVTEMHNDYSPRGGCGHTHPYCMVEYPSSRLR